VILSRHRFLHFVGAACATFAFTQLASALDFPTRQVRVIVPFPPGGATDTVARILADHFSAVWKQPVIVENRPGGNTVIGAVAVAHSVPDGYSLMLAAPSLSTFKALFKQPSVDVEKDLAPISQLTSYPLVLAVNAGLPVNTLSEFIAYAKKNPGKLNYGAAAASLMLSSELFKKVAGIDLLRVPYQGEALALTALARGDVQLVLTTTVTAQAMIHAGLVKALAVTTSERSPTMPEVPTMAEAGLPEFDASNWFGLVAPANTPLEIRRKIADEIAVFVKRPDVIGRYATLGLTPRSSTPEEFARLVSSEIRRWSEVAQFAAIEPQ
jgi:tripartite-type tricarboxylate transporter receptor subunit TctC